MNTPENSEPSRPLAVPLSDQLGLVAKLRDPAQATNWGAADNLMNEAADEIERLQARIDALMLEYCPDEMTPEQLANWAAHQRPCSEADHAAVAAALKA